MINNNKITRGTSSGVAAGDLLALVFITLRLCGVINWSWWWVLSPFWIPLAIIILIILIEILITCVKHLKRKKKRAKE